MRGLLRHLPLPDYYKALLWSRTLKRPRGDVTEWPYFRSIELAMLGIKSGYGAGACSRTRSLRGGNGSNSRRLFS